MNDLEKALQNLRQPPIQVEAFKRNLRADLLQKMQVPRRSNQLGFAIASTLASAFGTLLILFILKPHYPQQIRAWIDGESQDVQAVPATYQAGTVRAPLPSGPQESGGIPVRTYLPSEELDRRIVQDLFEKKLSGHKPQLQSVENKGVFSIREFISEDGKRVLVYTKIDDASENDTITVSY